MNEVDLLSNPLLSSIAATQQQREVEAEGSGQELGQDAFLRLMIAQLNNQDPLSPQDNGEFISQIAQFSSVEGITNVNNSINALLEEVRSGRTVEAASLIGQTVEINSNVGRLVEGEGLSGSYVLGASSPTVTLNITDSVGSLVYSENLGTRPAGEHRFTWDGIGDDGSVLPSGDYNISVTALENGESVQLSTQVAEVVEGLFLDAGNNVILNLASGQSVAISDIQRLSQTTVASNTQDLSQTLDSLVGQFQSSRALEASALVGQSVQYAGSTVQHQSNGSAVSANVVVPAGEQAVFSVVDNTGSEVFSQVLDSAGTQTIVWNGFDDQGNAAPSGEYQLRVTSLDGTSQDLPLVFTGSVNSVTLGSGSSDTALNIEGAGAISLDQIIAVV